MIRIGITVSDARDEDGGVHPDVRPYVAAVRAAGAEAVLLEGSVAGRAGEAAFDGLIFSGGVDVDPARYGGRLQHARSQVGRYRADRDELEIGLAHRAREHRIPTLCICRGLQVVNVAFGGTLIEDVREEFGERYRIHHRQTYEDGRDRSDYADGHDVALDPSSAIAKLVGAASLATNSMHHQAIRELGDGLKVAGRTSDGVIEALAATFDHPFFVAVQWHPEELDDAPNRALFSGLVSAAARRREVSPA